VESIEVEPDEDPAAEEADPSAPSEVEPSPIESPPVELDEVEPEVEPDDAEVRDGSGARSSAMTGPHAARVKRDRRMEARRL
jgi:hypothetical protein